MALVDGFSMDWIVFDTPFQESLKRTISLIQDVNVSAHLYPSLYLILEKVAVSRLECHLQPISLLDDLQSAYCTGHSTETVLLRVHHDITFCLKKLIEDM
jgi:hypothetical protein